MKTVLLYGILFLLTALPCKAQQADSIDDDTTVYIVADEMPEFPGGYAAMAKFIRDNLRLRIDSVEDEICYISRIVVEFIVEKNGSISNIKIKKSACEKYANELIRVVESMPKWKPGMQNGSPIRVRYVIPIIR